MINFKKYFFLYYPKLSNNSPPPREIEGNSFDEGGGAIIRQLRVINLQFCSLWKQIVPILTRMSFKFTGWENFSERSEAKDRAESRVLDWVRKKSEPKKSTTTTTIRTTNFVPGQTIDFPFLICTFLSLFQAPKSLPICPEDILRKPC